MPLVSTLGYCQATAAVLSRHTGYDANPARAQVQASAQATKSCGASCAVHQDAHGHRGICAQACREAEQALNALLAQLEPRGSRRPAERGGPAAGG